MCLFTTNSPDETEEIGYKLGKILNGGEVICLNGDLGTGKTAFTKGIAKALDIEEYITSPTFALVNEYSGRLKLNHFDVYRISDEDELLEIGFEDYIYSDSVSVVEWSELISGIIPENRIEVTINKELSTGENVRKITISFIGNKLDKQKIQFTGRLL